MKFEVLEGLYPDSRKAGTNNFDLTPFFPAVGFERKKQRKAEGEGCWDGGTGHRSACPSRYLTRWVLHLIIDSARLVSIQSSGMRHLIDGVHSNGRSNLNRRGQSDHTHPYLLEFQNFFAAIKQYQRDIYAKYSDD